MNFKKTNEAQKEQLFLKATFSLEKLSPVTTKLDVGFYQENPTKLTFKTKGIIKDWLNFAEALTINFEGVEFRKKVKKHSHLFENVGTNYTNIFFHLIEEMKENYDEFELSKLSWDDIKIAKLELIGFNEKCEEYTTTLINYQEEDHEIQKEQIDNLEDLLDERFASVSYFASKGWELSVNRHFINEELNKEETENCGCFMCECEEEDPFEDELDNHCCGFGCDSKDECMNEPMDETNIIEDANESKLKKILNIIDSMEITREQLKTILEKTNLNFQKNN